MHTRRLLGGCALFPPHHGLFPPAQEMCLLNTSRTAICYRRVWSPLSDAYSWASTYLMVSQNGRALPISACSFLTGLGAKGIHPRARSVPSADEYLQRVFHGSRSKSRSIRFPLRHWERSGRQSAALGFLCRPLRRRSRRRKSPDMRADVSPRIAQSSCASPLAVRLSLHRNVCGRLDLRSYPGD
jgi:hypothetical protein